LKKASAPISQFTIAKIIASWLISSALSTHGKSLWKALCATLVDEVERPMIEVATAPAIKDLFALREEEAASESPITVNAFSIAKALLEFAHSVLGELPRTLIVPDSEGGIGIEWVRDDRRVRVIIPALPDQLPYVYQRVGRESKIETFSNPAVVHSLQ